MVEIEAMKPSKALTLNNGKMFQLCTSAPFWQHYVSGSLQFNCQQLILKNMIITEVFYGLKCNRCGELYEDGEHSFWNDESSAIENAYESDWTELKGKHYCPNCHEIDEETDEVKVYEEYPQHLKTLNGFIDRILHGTRRNVIENDNNLFLIKCQFYKKPKLDLFEVEYIKSLLGDKFISLDYEEGKYNSFTCCIKFKK